MNDKIQKRITSDYSYVSGLGYTVLGVFLQDSQNYNLAYEGSDIDTKAIILPSFEDFCLNRKPVSTTLILPTNEHIDLKDIRLMHECFRKQNINFVEILFTKYRYLNPNFKALYLPMFIHAEDIAHYNNFAAVNCIAGMVFEKRKALCHPYEGLREKIEKYGYDNKQLHHILRCGEFLRRYIDGVPYAECLIPTFPQDLIDIKSSYIYSKDEAVKMADEICAVVQNMKQDYMNTHEVVINQEAANIMNNTLVKVLKKNFMIEMEKNNV